MQNQAKLGFLLSQSQDCLIHNEGLTL